MDYRQTLDYLYRQLPIFQRVGKAAYKADLSNTLALCAALGNPEDALKGKAVHIAGTNGKGSTSHIVASILQEAGLKVGLYTSPHLRDFRERIKLNGEMIPEQYVVDFVAKYKNSFEPVHPSFFELTVGMAFQYFKEEEVDIAVIEVGLGGRLDSTNVITPAVSVITNISLDHTNLLGNTVEEIAMEKAGIIKAHIPVVIGYASSITRPLFSRVADERITSIQFTQDLTLPKLQTDLGGSYQQANVRTAQAAINVLLERGWDISEEHIIAGAGNVVRNTGFAGRWQTLSQNPLTITDIGHNEDGIRQVLHQIEQTPHTNLHMVIGMVNDKDVDAILELLPSSASYYFCEAKIPRALPVADLAAKAAKSGLQGQQIADVNAALEAAKKAATTDDLVFVGGSAFVVAEVV